MRYNFELLQQQYEMKNKNQHMHLFSIRDTKPEPSTRVDAQIFSFFGQFRFEQVTD
jgi:hypothetical protein